MGNQQSLQPDGFGRCSHVVSLAGMAMPGPFVFKTADMGDVQAGVGSVDLKLSEVLMHIHLCLGI